ncbi:MAG TPA: pantoate--beta-alanine ligase [Chthoniobacteraceae bacterium]|jgi:pantoate--beta-alanine ligase|nr:pantoate--beta-alanine ligase [Chthoniobacteraceae bacterium]
MKITRTISGARRLCKATAGPIVLVPTMGALHAGHEALCRQARRIAGPNGFVVVSIFVNPTQFGPNEDLAKYPRTFDADRARCAAAGVDLIFHPSAAEMYPADFSTFVDETAVSSLLCGASRPGHFRGVCTVVLKLFSIIAPDVAVFGEKDFQQCAVIGRMVRDLDLPIRLRTIPTVRESDGLALSSRNRYLTPEERAQAPTLRRALLEAKAAFRAGETRAAQLRKRILKIVSTAPLARIDYVEVAHSQSLQPVRLADRATVIALAVFFGKTRLIDNILLK